MALTLILVVAAVGLWWKSFHIFAWIAATAAILTFFALPAEWILWVGVVIALIVAFTTTVETGMRTAIGLFALAIGFVVISVFSPSWLRGWDINPSSLRNVEFRSPIVFPTPTEDSHHRIRIDDAAEDLGL